MKISRLHENDTPSDDFVGAFNALSENQQIDFLVDIATNDKEMREIILSELRDRGLLA